VKRLASTTRHLLVAAALLIAPAVQAAHPATSRDMAGVWLPDSKRSDRPPKWPLRPEAAESRAKWLAEYGPVDPRIDDLSASCIAEPMPWPARLIAQYPFELLFTPDRVTIFYEVFGSLRRIPIGAPRNTFDALPSSMGTSTGHWEGDVLVVVTTGLNGFTQVDEEGRPKSSAMKVTERYMKRGPDQLEITYTLDDPRTYSRPWTARAQYRWAPDLRFSEYVCEENNRNKPDASGKLRHR